MKKEHTWIVDLNGSTPDFDLKPGMMVEIVSGNRYLVVPFHEYGGYLRLAGMKLGKSGYISDIPHLLRKNTHTTSFYVKAIGWPKELNSQTVPDFDTNQDYWTVDYKRLPLEVTLEDVADKFNIPVEQIRIKDK